MFSRGEDLALRGESRDRTRELEVGVGDCASVTGEFGACSAQNCEDVLCFMDFGAVAGGDWAAVAEGAVNVLGGEANRTRVKNRLE